MGQWGDMWPIEWGGAPTRADVIHRALRSARGVGGSGPEGGIEDAWIRCEAEAIAASESATDRAIANAHGFSATDLLETLERIYGLDPAGTEQDRRERVAAFELEEARADCPTLAAELAAISPHFTIETIPRDEQIVTYGGKWLGARSGLPFYGAVGQRFANYSDAYVLHVNWDVVAAGGLPSLELVARAARLLRERLPAWMDFQVHQLTGGWIAGESVAGFGAVRE